MEYLRTDYHVHPNYSIDAFPVQIREYCKKALELNLAEICFTTHIELEPERREIDNFVIFNGEKISVFNHAWLDSYLSEIAQANQEFRHYNLKVKAGIEVGYCRGCEKYVEEIVNNYPFDFVLGAIHCLDHIAISSMKESPYYFQNKSLAELRKEYFTTLEEMVTTGLFDCIAHLDLYIRYGLRHYGPEILTIHRGVIESIFSEMTRRGMGLEVNTSSRRRGLKEFHPIREILDLAARAGIKIFTVGSDAHSLDQLGDYIDEALDLLKDLNLRNHVFTRRKAVPC
ncbi:MAG: histidinol-phosphatase HisJ family protein [Clostridiaceae bacterium]|nr:histidinol-phosphatase HisJ family protein [Clostridiaceae bacterium]